MIYEELNWPMTLREEKYPSPEATFSSSGRETGAGQLLPGSIRAGNDAGNCGPGCAWEEYRNRASFTSSILEILSLRVFSGVGEKTVVALGSFIHGASRSTSSTAD